MPELPEVETMRRGLLPLVGQRLLLAQRPQSTFRPISIKPRIDALSRRIAQKKIVQVERCGKRVLLRLNDEQLLVIEPRMTGLVLIGSPPTSQHVRFRIQFCDGPHQQLLFWDRRGLGTVRLLRKTEIESYLGPHKIGPDALAITANDLNQQLGKSLRAIKVALLDQRIVAGIGNIYAAEILHLAGIDPRTQCAKLTGPQWDRIQQATHAILETAIRYEGSTLSDGTYRNSVNRPGSYQSQHQVYDRAGKSCNRCKQSEIFRVVQSQRATFFCPVCQRKSGMHPSVRLSWV